MRLWWSAIRKTAKVSTYSVKSEQTSLNQSLLIYTGGKSTDVEICFKAATKLGT